MLMMIFMETLRSGRGKIINHDFVQGQGNPPLCQRYKTSMTQQASSWTENLWYSDTGGFPPSLYKVVIDSYKSYGLHIAVRPFKSCQMRKLPLQLIPPHLKLSYIISYKFHFLLKVVRNWNCCLIILQGIL